jgi:alpha-glucuronidase
MELQITQEYTGQQRHLVYLAPMWKECSTSICARRIVDAGERDHRRQELQQPLGGMIGVAGVGRDNWLGSPLAMANLYAFGRLAWDPNLQQTRSPRSGPANHQHRPQVVATVDKMLMQSWPAYEHYTGPLGTQTLTDITGSHYGPNIESSERNGWGQWHRDDAKGIGMDRSVATGTGFAGQYPPGSAPRCTSRWPPRPTSLLLFFHHVPYTYKLHSGKTVIQYIYDSHYEGADQAAQLGNEWATLKGKIDPAALRRRARASRISGRPRHRLARRDRAVLLQESGIPDAQGRAGHYPGRLEAEDARLTGYKVIDVTPWEDASGGKAVACD